MRLVFAIALVVIGLSLAVASPEPSTSPQPAATPVQQNASGCNITGVFLPNVDCSNSEAIEYTIAAVIIVIGLIWTFFGYRLIRVVLFFAGAILFAFVTYQTLSAIPQVAEKLEPIYILLIAAGAGLLGGIIVLLLFKVGIFLLGFMFGAVVGVVVMSFTPLTTTISDNIHATYTTWVILACVVGLGILCGILAVVFIRPIVIFITAWNGSFIVMQAVDRMAKTNLLYILQAVFNRKVEIRTLDAANWPVYVMFGGLVLLALLGILVQARFTARGHHHDPQHNRKPKGEEEYPLVHGIQDV